MLYCIIISNATLRVFSPLKTNLLVENLIFNLFPGRFYGLTKVKMSHGGGVVVPGGVAEYGGSEQKQELVCSGT